MPSPDSKVVIVMGVSGAGKTTVGKALAERLGWHFLEGDDFHPLANVAKMRNGGALDDQDRQPWLAALSEAISAQLAAGEPSVLTCSALKASYRKQLQVDQMRVRFVYLEGDPELLHTRVQQRLQHFMPAQLLHSQLQTLEAPREALLIDAREPVERILGIILATLDLQPVTSPKSSR